MKNYVVRYLKRNTMHYLLIKAIIIGVFFDVTNSSYCGCKTMRPCYKRMLDALLQPDEEPCIENVDIGSSTVTVFLKAINGYCSRTVKVISDSNSTTYEGRNLYEVVINSTMPGSKDHESLPVIVIDAGQDAGIEPAGFALYIIEQLAGCFENREMIQKVRWVILPYANPDGLEYSRSKIERWNKNLNHVNGKGYGVDVTRNFDDSWNNCQKTNNIFSQSFPGRSANLERETKFISNVLHKYKPVIKTYVSFRRDGHGIFYPFSARNITFESAEKVKKRAGGVAAKVNQRAGGIQWFVNESIFNMNGKARCGSSVDYAVNRIGVPYSFEMRLFSETDNYIMSKFQTLPKGHEVSLRAAYFSGIRELYNYIVAEKKQKDKLK